MKTMLLEIEDDRLALSSGSCPPDRRVYWARRGTRRRTEPSGLSLEEATTHVLAKNAELYERLS
uniref:Uncharacterized protein n=1 Tax=Candidatus Kentrum sp. UNK TaxID=2126344 RepID=A0A451B2Z9_9GAMM|nr:MAG: hypothetical protein BECKUNK1418G_GA0071005_11348 [Candidatus Kentron sp. UNK]VFK72625.1 MAG: hypothetical protein BECKUNK1418H_GA0071006_11268 [Candidatus Kentron sp. UNK]